jgi:hypothetical protein
MARTRIDTDKETILNAQVQANPITKYLLRLLDNPKLTDDLGRKDFIHRLQIKPKEFEKLVDYLEQIWGLEKTSKESWLQFFERAIFEIDNYDAVAQEVTQGQVPDNIQELVSELDNFEDKLEQNRQKIKAKIKGKLSLKETDRFITRLMEKYQGEIPENITEQEIAMVAAEHELENYVNTSLKEKQPKNLDPQTRFKQNQKRFNDILAINQRQVETIVQGNAPETEFSDQELESIYTESLGKTSAWKQTIQQKCDNYAEIINQIEATSKPETLSQQAEIADKVQPVLKEHVKGEISKTDLNQASQDIAISMMTAKSQGWEIETNESSVASTQISLALTSQKIELEKPMAVQQIADAALEPLSEMKIDSNTVETINQTSIQANVSQHLVNKGLDLSPDQLAESSQTFSNIFYIPGKTEVMNLAFHTHPENKQGEKDSNLVKRLSKIPRQPSDLLRVYQENTYQSFLKQVFVYNYAKNFTSQELKGEISRLSQIQSYTRTTTAHGPIIDVHSLQLNAAQTVINHPLYRTMSPLINMGKSKLVNRLGQTAIGQGLKTGINKAGSWLAQKIGIAGIELAGEGAAGGTIAAALGVPTGGSSLLIWGGIELLKKGGKAIIGGFKKFFKGVSGFFKDIISSGKAEATRQKGGILETLQKGAPAVGAAINSLLALTTSFNVGPIIVTSFIIFFGVMLLGFFPQHLMTQSRRRPPLGRGDEQGVSQEELNIDSISVDLDSCDIPSDNARNACTLSKSFNQCFSEGKITENNSHLVEECIRKTEALMTILSESQIRHIVDSISYSANTYNVLQCVGFKRAVEPGLPGCGDAKHFVNSGCGRCRPANPIGPGVNAVFTGGSFGHIAIVLEADEENGLVTLAQAWGGSGRVNFTQVPIASVDEFIDCR